MKIITIVILLALSGCSVFRPVPVKATTPVPTVELTAIGTHSTKAKSYKVAMGQAERFCNRWNTAPSITRKQVKYQGVIQEDTQSAITIATNIAQAAGAAVPDLDNRDNYETTITYKCY